MTSADILLLLILAGAFLIGFFWGIVRGLLALAAWVVVFLLSAHLSVPVGDYLTRQWSNFSPEYTHMLSFLIVYALLMLLSLILIHIGVKGSQDVSRWPLADDLVGGALAVALAILIIAGTIAILQIFYKPEPLSSASAQWTLDLYNGLHSSTIGGQIESGLVPFIASILGPLLPPSVRGAL
jgi:uncharacterized membrane protein required for colicin V production